MVVCKFSLLTVQEDPDYSFLKNAFILFYMYDRVSCMCVCVPHAYLVLKRGDQINALELELWMVFNHNVGTVTGTQVLCKNK